MIQCDHFFDLSAGMHGEGSHNVRVSDDHTINANFPTFDEARTVLATVWNERHPENQVAADGTDFEFTDHEPW